MPVETRGLGWLKVLGAVHCYGRGVCGCGSYDRDTGADDDCTYLCTMLWCADQADCCPLVWRAAQGGIPRLSPARVFEQVTGFGRRAFTTMEANRILSRLGFPRRRASDYPGWPREATEQWEPASLDRRLSAIEATLAVAQEAIASLRNRVSKLEGRR
jgi:hypothetical protein